MDTLLHHRSIQNLNIRVGDPIMTKGPKGEVGTFRRLVTIPTKTFGVVLKIEPEPDHSDQPWSAFFTVVLVVDGCMEPVVESFSNREVVRAS